MNPKFETQVDTNDTNDVEFPQESWQMQSTALLFFGRSMSPQLSRYLRTFRDEFPVTKKTGDFDVFPDNLACFVTLW